MKYLIKVKIEVDGIVDKPDVIGAIFGQTEGLLGPDFDLRDLQDKGRIGRIQVDLKTRNSKTIGEVVIPSNLDRIETALIAAMIETIDKVGPYGVRIKVSEIVDLREERVKRIIERAKEILKSWGKERGIDYKAIVQEVSKALKPPEITKYGPEGLPAGPDVDKSDTLIIVEGRADVLNLLRYGYTNVIALEGATGKIPNTIIKLAESKKTIAFVDGDHGGDLILKELLKFAKIDYVARAPPGREVEDLTGKEIEEALANKVPAADYLVKMMAKKKPKPAEQVEVKATERLVALPDDVLNAIKGLKGTLESILYNEKWEAVKRVPVRDLVDTLSQAGEKEVYAVVLDGIITPRLVDTASAKGVQVIIGTKMGAVTKRPFNLQLLTFDDIL